MSCPVYTSCSVRVGSFRPAETAADQHGEQRTVAAASERANVRSAQPRLRPLARQPIAGAPPLLGLLRAAA